MSDATKGFAQLARAVALDPTSATVLSAVARHPDATDGRVRDLMNKLEGDAYLVAQHLVGEGTSGSDDVRALAALYRKSRGAASRR